MKSVGTPPFPGRPGSPTARSQPAKSYRPTLVAALTLACVGAAAFMGTAAPATAQDRDQPLDGSFEEIYRAGGVNAPEWAQFTRPEKVGFDASGNLFVLDILAAEVIVIGAEGQLVRTIGGPGEGPGEFRSAADMVVWRDGRIAVADMGHNAYQVFSPAGELDHFVGMGGGDDPFAAMTTLRTEIRGTPDGGALVAQGVPEVLGGMSGMMAEMMGTEVEDGDRVDDRGLERLDLAGDVVVAQPILQAWSPPSEAAEALTMDDMIDVSTVLTQMIGQVTHYKPALLWDLLPDGTIAYSDSSAYAIKLLSADGATSIAVRRPLHPETVTPRIRAATIERRIEEMQENMESGPAMARGMMALLPGDPMEAMREGLESAPFHHEIPVIRAIRATWDGSLWIQRRGEKPWDDAGPIDVFSADGQYVGTFSEDQTGMPSAFGPDGRVAFIELDEFDVPSIVVRTLPAEVR